MAKKYLGPKNSQCGGKFPQNRSKHYRILFGGQTYPNDCRKEYMYQNCLKKMVNNIQITKSRIHKYNYINIDFLCIK